MYSYVSKRVARTLTHTTKFHVAFYGRLIVQVGYRQSAERPFGNSLEK